MTGNKKSEGVHGGFGFACGASAEEHVGCKSFKEVDGALTGVFHLEGDLAECAPGGIGLGGVGVFIERGERGLIVAAEAKGAVGEDPFGIQAVAEHFADGPLIGGIAMVSEAVGDGVDEFGGAVAGDAQGLKDVGFLDEFYIVFIVVGYSFQVEEHEAMD